MVKLRLRRMGRKKRPVYDIVAADSRSPRDGRFIEKVGQYNPMVVANQVTLRRDRVMHWLGNGAQPTDTVRSILSREGVLLEVHLGYKGKDASEIAQSVENHIAGRQNREANDLEAVARDREARQHAEEEAMRAKEKEAEDAARAAAEAEAAEAAASVAAASAETDSAAVAEEAPVAETDTEAAASEAPAEG